MLKVLPHERAAIVRSSRSFRRLREAFGVLKPAVSSQAVDTGCGTFLSGSLSPRDLAQLVRLRQALCLIFAPRVHPRTLPVLEGKAVQEVLQISLVAERPQGS